MPTILAIETSCDETAAAVVTRSGRQINIRSNIVASQIDIHAAFGGVVPEVAARHHAEQIIPVIDEALSAAQVTLSDIDSLAVTAGPGLMTSLMVGVETARTLSFARRIPLIAVNHMYAHVAAALCNQPVAFPAIALIVSGGHTELLLLRDHTHYRLVGRTVDDAIGEAYDKAAKLLGLPYPGGPAIAKLAVDGDPTAYQFPRPMINSGDYKFSYSGLKTALLYTAQKLKKISARDLNNLCASFQRAAIDVVLAKTFSAATKYKAKSIIIGGGVAANEQLRSDFATRAGELATPLYFPARDLCTDNAAMIGIAAQYMTQDKKPLVDGWHRVKVDPNWELK